MRKSEYKSEGIEKNCQIKVSNHNKNKIKFNFKNKSNIHVYYKKKNYVKKELII